MFDNLIYQHKSYKILHIPVSIIEYGIININLDKYLDTKRSHATYSSIFNCHISPEIILNYRTFIVLPILQHVSQTSSPIYLTSDT